MREIFTYGYVGGALGNRCFYPENPTVLDERGACGNVMQGLTAFCHETGNGGYIWKSLT